MLRLTTIGTGTVALSPRRACAGTYIESGDLRLLIDCGSGVLRRIAELGMPWQSITHVALTHFHIDHHGDLPTLVFAWRYGMLPRRSEPLEIIGPPGTVALLDRLTAAYGEWVTAPGFPLAVRELPQGDTTGIAGVTLASCAVPHTPESVA
jgi:ribonuclease BN (tRNA processing enzyme)